MPKMTVENFKIACTKIKILLFDCDGVLTDGRIVLGNDDFELKFFSTKDGMGINLWRRAGFPCGAITARRSLALERRAKELGFEELHQGISDKRVVVEEIGRRRDLAAEEIAYVGDDLNDLVVLGRVGLFFAPADAHPETKKRADKVLSQSGGHGAIRETVDLILKNKGLLEKVVASIIA